MTQVSELFRVEVGRVHFVYRRAGAGAPVWLIHGLSGSGRWWKKNVAALAPYYTVYTLDLCGFGDSRGQPFSLSSMGDILWSWWQKERELYTQGLRLVAHSMGGHIAAELAVRYPQQIQGLVLADALAQPIGRSVLSSALHLLRALPTFQLDFFARLSLDALRAGPGVLASAAGQLHRHIPPFPLSSIHTPTLVVWGKRDYLLPFHFACQLHAQIPHARLVILPGAGHIPMWEQPEVFNTEVLRFFAELPGHPD